MPWNTARGWAIKQIAFGFLAMIIVVAAGLPSVAQDSRHGQGRMLADPSANAGNEAGAQASNSLAATPRSTTADDNSSSRRNLDYPAPQVATGGSSKNSSAASDGAFADGDASAADQQAADADDTAPVFATTFNDPPSRPAASVEAASFSGVQPGVTTADDLADQWGKGKEISHDDNQTVVSFSRPSFPHVEVTLVDDKVRSVVINLDQSVPTDTLARELHLDGVRPVDVPDDSGELLGQAYPERGVLFSITPDGKRVSHVLLDKIDLVDVCPACRNGTEYAHSQQPGRY